MSTKHTPGPWSERNGRIFQADRPNLTIANIARAFDGDYSSTNARRIVACVNACEGISTDAIETDGSAVMGWVRAASKLLRLRSEHDELQESHQAIKEQRDELLAALRAVDVLFGHLAKDSTQKTWIDNARAAIAKVEGTGA